MKPIIGMTCSALVLRSGRPVYSVNQRYIQAVEAAGGVVVLLPLLKNEEDMIRAAGRLDGLLLPGGEDIAPVEYGEEPHPALEETSPARDGAELALTHWAMKKRLPILGICRGQQMLNVALGGTLYQDMAAEYPDACAAHLKPCDNRTDCVHTLEVVAGSHIASALNIPGGTSYAVNSLHHQAIKRLGASLRASATAPDGVIEAVEGSDPGHFVLAVQYHPEELFDTDPHSLALFQTFVAACG